MNMNDYQQAALKTDLSKGTKNQMLHLVLGLVGESGEIAEKFKKIIRDQNSDESKVDTADLKKELGDVMWYIAILADYFDITLDDIASSNVAKLKSRQQRGVLGGSGDER